MSKLKGLIEWFEACPLVKDAGYIDVNQLGTEERSSSIYKQPSVTITELIDGSKLVSESYYLLFRRAGQLKEDRFDNEEYLDAIENWVEEQGFLENYPDIGFEVYKLSMSNATYMSQRDETDAIYQLTITISYERKAKYD